MSIRVGVPKETKPLEGRVALTPSAASAVIGHGARCGIQQGAGLGSGFPDDAYRAVGVEIMPDADALYDWAELVVKVKEPVGDEIGRLKADHVLFSYLHLAALPALTQALCDIGLTAIAFESVSDGGRLPILQPMSDIAGRLAVQIGAKLLHTPEGGKGLLLGGLATAERGEAVVLGGGNAGSAAVRAAATLGANVTVFDRQPTVLERMHQVGPNVTGLIVSDDAVSEAVVRADLVIGAVLLPSAETPRVVTRRQLAAMAPGGVVVDISVDQGGCIETTRPTSYDAPTYMEEGIVHFCVTNMPGAVPRSASQALSAAMLPYLLGLLTQDWRDDPRLSGAINVDGGAIVHPALK